MTTPQSHNFSFGEFLWWIGVVENRDDELGLGRVQVRIFGYHPESTTDLPTSDLPWAMTLQPTNSAAKAGVGSAPVGLQVGTHVMGYFADGKNAQVPIVMGSFLGMPNGVPDTNNLARGEDLQETVIEKKNSSLLTSSPTSFALDALSLTNSISEITTQISTQGIALRNITNAIQIPANITSIPGFDDIRNVADDLRQHIFRIESQISQVRALRASVEAFDAKQLLAREIGNYKAKLNALANVLGPAQARDLQAAIQGIDNIKNAANALQKADAALASVSQIAGAIGNLKSLAKTVGGGSAVSSVINSLKTGALSNIWQEIPTPAAPEYPLNFVTVTEGGHIQEFDSTPGAERYHRYHPSGTFTEEHPDGTKVEKVVKDKYSIVMGDDKVHIDGNVQVNIVGASNVVINGDCVQQVNGNMAQTVDGDYTIAVGGDFSVVVAGETNLSSGSNTLILAPRIDLNQ